MKVVIERQKLKFDLYPTNEGNYNIGSDDIDVSINFRGASLVCDYQSKKLTIVSNIVVELDYKGLDEYELKNKMKNDLSRFKEKLKESRLRKLI